MYCLFGREFESLQLHKNKTEPAKIQQVFIFFLTFRNQKKNLNIMNYKNLLFSSLLTIISILANAQQSILALNSSTKQVIQLNANDGTIVINPNFINLTSVSAGTIKGITQVDDKIWISDQTQNRIYIYNMNGTLSSTITANLSNLRGLNVVNNEVWVTNAGSTNGATANSIVRYTKTGTYISTHPCITSPFDVIDTKTGTAYISTLSTNGIQKMGYDGTVTGNFLAAGVFQNMQQINFNSDGDVIVAVFQSLSSSGNNSGIYVLSGTNASILNYWPVASGKLRGVIQTGNGNYLYSTEDGIYLITASSATGAVSQVTSGVFQYFTKIDTSLMSTSELKSASIQVYPNPTSDYININSKEKIEAAHLYSADGKLLKMIDGKSIHTQVSISELPAGSYILKLKTKDGEPSFKIIKI